MGLGHALAEAHKPSTAPEPERIPLMRIRAPKHYKAFYKSVEYSGQVGNVTSPSRYSAS